MITSTALVRYPRVMLGTCVVPWREDGTCDDSLFRRTIRHAAVNLTPHLYIFGTAGEGHAVTDRQFGAVTRMFVDEMRHVGGTPMVGGGYGRGPALTEQCPPVKSPRSVLKARAGTCSPFARGHAP